MTEIGQDIALELEHRYAAPRERVFDAWTNPEVLKRWWAAAPTWDTPLVEVDPRLGGSYRLSMRTDTGEVHTVRGEYKEVSPPERLAYTWSWEEGPEPAMAGSESSLVVVEFLKTATGRSSSSRTAASPTSRSARCTSRAGRRCSRTSSATCSRRRTPPKDLGKLSDS